jgi:hypothetical protein
MGKVVVGKQVPLGAISLFELKPSFVTWIYKTHWTFEELLFGQTL